MKIPVRNNLLVACLGLILSALPVLAHHSFAAEYDSKDLVTLTGVITKVEWTNPHIYFYIDVKDASGSVVELGRGRLSSQYSKANWLHERRLESWRHGDRHCVQSQRQLHPPGGPRSYISRRKQEVCWTRRRVLGALS